MNRVICTQLRNKERIHVKNTEKAVNIIDSLVNGLLQLKTLLSEEPVVSIASTPELSDFESLKKAVQSDKWPEAIPPAWICDPYDSVTRKERAHGIIDIMIEEPLAGLKFLDMGCGEGDIVGLASEQNSLAVGYDIAAKDYSWNKFPQALFSTDFEQIRANGPYNVILIYDVLDHVIGDPVELLKKAASVLAPNGKIYLRVHPFTSRHATHLYQKLNKAYLHLVFTPSELKEIIPDYVEEPNLKVVYPIKTYQTLIDNAGLKVKDRHDIKEIPEVFFKIPKIAERIMKTTGTTTFPDFQMTLQFIDYVLVV